MKKFTLSKASLMMQNKDLKLYQKYLPSLELKRLQLLTEKNKTLIEQQQLLKTKQQLIKNHVEINPMIANDNIDLSDLVQVSEVITDVDNLVGEQFIKFIKVKFEVKQYSLLVMPHWVDNLVNFMQQILSLEMHAKVLDKRVQQLTLAVKKVSQKVNLFEKILIPTTMQNIKKIKIFLSDNERAEVVRSKIAKKKRIAKEEL